jgi:hypothetical protein
VPGMRRREFVSLVGGAAAAWPLAARAQQPDRLRRVGILMPYSVDDVLGLELASALRDGLSDQGWGEGRNIEINYRWIGKDTDRRKVYAAELVAASPHVLFACYLAQLAPLALQTRTIPIVFVGVSDPVGSGYVESFARLGRNITDLRPTTGIAGCCARVASGHAAAALPRSVVNSRRFIMCGRHPPIHRNPRTYTMRNKLPMHRSTRCGALTRSRTSCQAPMPNGKNCLVMGCSADFGRSPPRSGSRRQILLRSTGPIMLSERKRFLI